MGTSPPQQCCCTVQWSFVVLCFCCWASASAQPLEGRLRLRHRRPSNWTLADDRDGKFVGPEALRVGKETDLSCPKGFYRTSGILWGRSGALGRRVVPLSAGGSVLVALLPVGLRNFSAFITTELDVALQLRGSDREMMNSSVLTLPGQAPDTSTDPVPFRYTHPSVDRDHLVFSGVLSRPCALSLVNLADEAGTAVLDYRFDGVEHCTDVPAGCLAFSEAAAAVEVRAWSRWARGKFGDADSAWDALLTVALDGRRQNQGQGESGSGSGRRLEEAAIGWFGWGLVWDYWGKGSPTGRAAAFHLMDGDHDEGISEDEFAQAFNLAGARQRTSLLPVALLVLLALLALLAWFYRKHPLVKALAAGDLELLRKQLLETQQSSQQGKVASRSLAEAQAEREALALLSNTGEEGERDPKGPSPEEAFRLQSAQERLCTVIRDPLSCAFGRGAGGRLPAATGTREEPVALVQAMRAWPRDAELQRAALRRLEDLALEPELKASLTGCGGPDAVLTAMYTHPSDEALQEHACAVLGNQACQSEQQQRVLVEQGAVRAVIKAMAEHPASPGVQETGCWSLRECALLGEGRREIADFGGIERLLLAMKSHPGSAALLEHGCMALAYLAHDPEVRRWIAYDGGVNVFLGSIQAQREDPAVQEAAILGLRNLACSAESRQAVLQLQGDTLVAEAMGLHGAVMSLQETACDCMLVLEPAPKRLLEVGMHDLALQALELHPKAEAVQGHACRLLAQVSRGDHMLPAQWHSKALTLVRAAQAGFPTSQEVQDAAADAIRAIGE